MLNVKKNLTFKNIKITLFCILAITLFPVCLSIFTNTYKYSSNDFKSINKISNAWSISVNDSKISKTSLPQKFDISSGDNISLCCTLPSSINDDDSIFLRSVHQRVKIYVNNELISSYGYYGDDTLGKTPGCAWVFAKLTSSMAGKPLRIELNYVYDNDCATIEDVKYSNIPSINRYIIMNHLVPIILSLLLIICGIVTLLFCILVKGKININTCFRLSICTLVLGFWSLVTTNTLQIVWRNPYQLYIFEFIIFSLIVPSFLNFFLSTQTFKNDIIIKSLFCISIIESTTIHMLQFFNLVDYINSIFATHILIILSIAYLFISVIYQVRTTKTRESVIMHITITIMSTAAIIDIIGFYCNSCFDEGFFTRIGIFLFIMIWIVCTIKEALKTIKQTTFDNIESKLAVVDIMTGLLNRNAFEERVYSMRKKIDCSEPYIVLIDMNNLKKVNDTYGHHAGDDALSIIGKCITQIFSGTCDLYRIGGDEFSILTNSLTYLNIENKIKIVKELIKNECADKEFDCTVAFGISKVNYKNDVTIDDAFKAADEKMYICKKQMKKCRR